MFTKASFLLSGQAYAFEVPDGVSPEPEMYGVIGVEQGVRYIGYRPTAREPDPRANHYLRHAYNLRNGSALVNVYRALDEPSTRVAYWKTATGYVSTFFDARMECGDTKIDTDEGIRAVVASITVDESAAKLPAVNVKRPVYVASPSDPFARQSIVFAHEDIWSGVTDAEALWPLIQIWSEPAFVPRGDGRWESDELAGRSVTTDLSITIEVQGPAKYAKDLERQSKAIAASATPL